MTHQKFPVQEGTQGLTGWPDPGMRFQSAASPSKDVGSKSLNIYGFPPLTGDPSPSRTTTADMPSICATHHRLEKNDSPNIS